jgi:acetylornithine deacetylase/succinyl-diaminopimelate desuccinylase-like protein
MKRTTATAALLLAMAATGATMTAAAASPVATAPAEVRAQARDIYRTIISFETSAGKGQVPVMARYLADRFRAAGLPADDIHVLPLGETASLVVRYAGDGTGGRPIVLLAHMDVVVAKREDWTRDPFTLVEENGYFFGRGTSDIKGDLALIAVTFIRLKAEGFVPTRDLIIAFTGDEETQMATTRSLIAKHRALLRDPEFALNADGGVGVLDETTGEAALYYVQGAEEALRDLRAQCSQSRRTQLRASPRQRDLPARRCAQGRGGLPLPGDVERLDDRQLSRLRYRNSRGARRGDEALRGESARRGRRQCPV